jgi:HK97 family phage portal protein
LRAYRGWVYGAVRIVSNVAAAGRLRFFYEAASGDKKYLGNEHPLVALFRQPNQAMTRWFFWSLTISWLELTGKAYWLKVRDNLGVPRMLIPLQPDWIKVVPSQTDLIQGFILQSGQLKLALAKEDVVYLRYPHPFEMWDGMGPLQAAAYSYDADFNMHKLDKRTFEKGGAPKGALVTDQYIGPNESEKLRSEWERLYGNVDTQKGIAVLHSGLDYKAIEVSRKDMEYAEGRRMTRQEIFAIFGVSEGLLGMVEDVNKTNNIALMDSFIRFTMQPKADMIQSQIDKDLVADFDDRIETEYELPEAMDVVEEHNTMETRLRSKLTSVNEEREKMNLPPASWGNVPWVSFSDIPADQVSAQQNSSEVNKNSQSIIVVTDEIAVDGRVAPELLNQYLRDNGLVVNVGQIDDTRKELIRNAFLGLHTPQENSYKRTMSDYFRQQHDEVRRRCDKALGSRTYDPALVEAILFDMKEWNARMGKSIKPRYIDAIRAAIIKALADLDIKASIDYNSPLVKEYIAKKLFQLPELVNSLTHNELRGLLNQAFKDNLSAAEVAAKIDRFFDGQNAVRALRIARTEITDSSNFGIIESWRQTGSVATKSWITMRDEEVRVAHHDVEKRTIDEPIPFDEPFLVAGVHMLYPGDPAAPAHLKINCRCTVVAREMK